jgi:predicted ATP-grasp superfamily ATP-dependent carboligase
MPPSVDLLIVGASARAAAFSALRAGLRPWCVDLFADADLQARCPVTRLSGSHYPQGILDAAERGPDGPWMYTGCLENYPKLVKAVAKERKLWGVGHRQLKPARSPDHLMVVLGREGLPCPAVFYEFPDEIPWEGRWIIKPYASGGGAGVRFWDGTAQEPGRRGRHFLQQYIEGESCSAVYVGDGESARLLGVTRQLVGDPRFHAPPMGYCGSIGPVLLSKAMRARFEKLGNALAAGCALRGLFGVDCILHDGGPWLIEVNPRYTASVEVLEYAQGSSALALHAHIFNAAVSPVSERRDLVLPSIVGKAILFARESLTFPTDGPWSKTLSNPADIWQIPEFADIPRTGEPIEKGRPICNLFTSASSVAECQERLYTRAADLERFLFGER